MSFVAEVKTNNDPKWYRNAVIFKTWGEAHDYGLDLGNRWTAVVEMRVAETKDEPNYLWINGNLMEIKKEAET